MVYDRSASPYSRDQPRYRSSGSQRHAPAPRSARATGFQGYLRKASRPSPRVIASGCVAAIVLVGVLAAGVSSCSNASFEPGLTTPLSSLLGARGTGPSSTPVEQWRTGEMPHLYQVDPAWADEPYAGATVGESGCGPTCLSMAYVYLTGKTDLTPPQMAAFSERNGYVEKGMTAWRLITEGSALLGLRAEELPASEGVVAGVLDAGQPVICSMGPGDFTTVGHFIVLCGRDENGDARVYDPNSPERSAQGWPLETVLGQALNLWALTRA